MAHGSWCLWHKGEEVTLCGEVNDAHVTSVTTFPIEDLCPRCLAKLTAPMDGQRGGEASEHKAMVRINTIKHILK